MVDEVEHGQDAARRAAAVVDKAYEGLELTPTQVGSKIAHVNRERNQHPDAGIDTFVENLKKRTINNGSIVKL